MNSSGISKVKYLALFTFIIIGFFIYKNKDIILKNGSGNKSVQIISIKGDVLVLSKDGQSQTPAHEGDTLSTDQSIETKKDSSVLLKFGENYECKIRVSENSKLTLSKLMDDSFDSQKELSVFKIFKGAIVVLLNNNNKKANVRFETRHASMGIKGTLFTIVTDEEKLTLLGVKHGVVASENNLTKASHDMAEGMTIINDKNGIEKIAKNSDLINSIDWNLESIEKQINLDLLISKYNMTSSGSVIEQTKESKDLLEKFQSKVFKIKQELDQQIANLKNQKLTLETSKPDIQNDLVCFDRNYKACTIKLEKVLLQRGYPLEYGNRKYTESLIEEVKKYEQEMISKIETTEKNIADIQKEYDHRNQQLVSFKERIENALSKEAQSEAVAELEKTNSEI
jgi:hypothetical protein